MNMEGMLDIHVDEKRHGARIVLRDLHLQIGAGEIVSLIGASGCGKSTLLSLVAGLDRAFRGSIAIEGRVPGDAPGAVGLNFQEPRLFPWLSVAENIAFGAGDGRSRIRAARVATLLEEVGLRGYEDALPKQLSGGQAQRVAIARGMYSQPRLLLLDEPFSAVDAFTRLKLQDLLLRIARQHQLTVLLVTHDIDEALHLSERVLLLDSVPAPLRAQFTVPLPRPRDRGDLALAPLKANILAQLHAAHAF
jgi:sulfonate transport system ATP-binding protein